MLATGRLVHIADLAANETYIEGSPPPFAAIAGIRTMVAVPLLKDSELMGWTEGSNRANDADRMRTLAKELVDLRPDAILGATTPVLSIEHSGSRALTAVSDRAFS
jgi:hypothetical protein